jgi:hypothetical protein
MSGYRRLYTPGDTYFFTVVTASRRPLSADICWQDVVLQLRTFASNNAKRKACHRSKKQLICKVTPLGTDMSL